MMKLIKILLGLMVTLVTMSLIAQTPPPTSEAQLLRDLLTDANCQRACFMGIEPGVTSQEQIIERLQNLNIQYTIQTQGLAIDSLMYSWIPASTLPYIDTNNGHTGATVYVSGETVSHILIPVNIPFSTVIAVYGAPDRVLESDGGNIEAIYDALGMVFFSNIDAGINRVGALYLVDSSVINQLFGVAPPFVEPFSDCSVFGTTCIVATATPRTATIIPTPTATP